MLNFSFFKTTKGVTDKIYIELDYSAQEIISKSERINIIQLVPYVCMEIDTCAARGEEQHIKFGGVKNV